VAGLPLWGFYANQVPYGRLQLSTLRISLSDALIFPVCPIQQLSLQIRVSFLSLPTPQDPPRCDLLASGLFLVFSSFSQSSAFFFNDFFLGRGAIPMPPVVAFLRSHDASFFYEHSLPVPLPQLPVYQAVPETRDLFRDCRYVIVLLLSFLFCYPITFFP